MSYKLCDYFFDEEKICELRWIDFDEKIHEQIINHHVNNNILVSPSGVKIFFVDFAFPYARYYCFLSHIYSCTIQNITCGVVKEIRLVFKLLDLYRSWFVIFEICYELYPKSNMLGVVAPRRYYTLTMYMYNQRQEYIEEEQENYIDDRQSLANKVEQIFEMLVVNSTSCESDMFARIRDFIQKTEIYCTSRTLVLIRYCNEYFSNQFSAVQQMCSCGGDFCDIYCKCACVRLRVSEIKNYCLSYERLEDIINNIVLLQNSKSDDDDEGGTL